MADLSLTSTASPRPVVSGQPLTYTITAASTGGLPATGVRVTDPLPASGHFDSMTASQGTCTRTAGRPNKTKGGTVTCRLDDLAAGATATVTIVITPTGQPGALTNAATATAGNVTPDGDDSATATVTVPGD